MTRWTQYIKGDARNRYISKNCDVVKGYKFGSLDEIKQSRIYSQSKNGSHWKWVLFYHTLTYLLENEIAPDLLHNLEQMFIEYHIHPEYNTVATINRNFNKMSEFFDGDNLCKLRQSAYIAGFFEE